MWREQTDQGWILRSPTTRNTSSFISSGRLIPSVAGYVPIRLHRCPALYKRHRGIYPPLPVYNLRVPADKCIQFFVVIILYLFADGSQQAVTFANFVLSAALYVDFLYFRKTVQFSVIYFLLQSFVADIPAIIATMASNTRPTISIHIITNQIFAKVLINLYYSVYLSLQCAK